MTPAEIEAALLQAFGACEAIGLPMKTQQKQILLQFLVERIKDESQLSDEASSAASPNPLDELTPDQRQVLLQFIQTQNQEHRSWKAQLLNDWLHNRDSGVMQFIRQLYGLQWLERVKPKHIAQYADEMILPLKVGDRIEVANSLWEWVQEEGPCRQEWFPCTVIGISEISMVERERIEPLESAASSFPTSNGLGDSLPTSCTIRFDSGVEYEIQGIYEWNRYNWRWSNRNEPLSN